MAAPLVSVVVRSYRRPAALKELVAALRRQAYPSFEIVVLEQSDDPALVAELESLGDARLRVFVSPPLDPPAARNEAIRRSQGAILLFVDDDDVPLGTNFIDAHVANYRDPDVMGVVGRLTSSPDGDPGPRHPRIARHFAMRRSFFWDTRALAHNTLPKDDIDFLIGSNASVRRALVERVGGWDEGIPMNEELSFSIRFHRARTGRERFVFDPTPALWRRTDVPGGLDRRAREDWYRWELDARLFYYRHVVGHYFPVRYRMLAPLFSLRAASVVVMWIWDPDNQKRTLGERARATVDTFLALPRAARSSRFRPDAVRRMETWR